MLHVYVFTVIQLEALDISGSQLMNLEGLVALVKHTPNVKVVNLGKNKVSYPCYSVYWSGHKLLGPTISELTPIQNMKIMN